MLGAGTGGSGSALTIYTKIASFGIISFGMTPRRSNPLLESEPVLARLDADRQWLREWLSERLTGGFETDR
jgi:hypothetical protein